MGRQFSPYLRAGRQLLSLAIALGVLSTVVLVAQMLALSLLVSHVFLDHAGLSAVGPLLALFLAAGALRAAFNGTRAALAQRAAIRVKSQLRRELFAQVLRLGPAYSQGERAGELVAIANEGIERLESYVGIYLPQSVLSVVVPLMLVLAILPVDVISAIILLVTAPLIPLLMALVGSYAQAAVDRQWGALRRMSAHFLDVVQGLPTLILLGRAEDESARVGRVSERFRTHTLKALRVAFLSGFVLEFMTMVAIGLVALTLGIRLLDGNIAFWRAFLVLLLAPEFYRPLRELGSARHAGMEGQAALARLAEVLNVPAPATSMPQPTTAGAGELTLACHHITFTYPGSQRPALDDITCVLRPGTRTALVGPSGSGKSTFVNLALRFLDPRTGQIEANGVALQDMTPAAWREFVALVPQRPYLFAGTVRENLRLARPDASDAAILQAAELAGAAEFIAGLPHGYETVLGERGARLSAGQAQRLAIARAFLKDAPLLVLDEPTSSLDPESEALVTRSLRLLMAGRTVLIVAHRLNTVRDADAILVLDQGRLVEAGTHDELAVRGGLYSHFLAAQRPTQPAAEVVR